jgi:hypothetical protein
MYIAMRELLMEGKDAVMRELSRRSGVFVGVFVVMLIGIGWVMAEYEYLNAIWSHGVHSYPRLTFWVSHGLGYCALVSVIWLAGMMHLSDSRLSRPGRASLNIGLAVAATAYFGLATLANNSFIDGDLLSRSEQVADFLLCLWRYPFALIGFIMICIGIKRQWPWLIES